jgi:hypothetical protein
VSRRPQNYVEGDYPAQCDRCGFEWLASQMQDQPASAPGNPPSGLMVCPECYDPPHPNDNISLDPPRVPRVLPFVRRSN